MVRLASGRHVGDQLRQPQDLADQDGFLLLGQQIEMVRRWGQPGFRRIAQHAGAARVGVLDVGGGILPGIGRCRRRQVEVHLRVGRALEHEEPGGVRPDLFDELSQGHDFAGSLRHAHAFFSAAQMDQLVEQHFQRLAVAADGGYRRLGSRDVTLVVGAPDIDHGVKFAGEELVVVVGHI